MAYVALYREWRPKVFEDVIGQDNIIRTIKNQILSNTVPHAYLFCGTRGTGKTSTAKIFSKAVNCLNPHDANPCNECEICKGINEGTIIDVVEIDAASNTGVDNIRDIIDDVKYPPHVAKHKVYIIDEVHMLSIQAFNALLKTIEEPPSHVIFILATTDPQKVPPTILSRCQKFEFKRIRTKDMVERLRKIANEKGVLVEDRTLSLIARVSDGAARDALSVFDQSMSMNAGKVEYDDVVTMLGLTSGDYILNLVDAMIKGDVETAIKSIDEILFGGKDSVQFIKELVKHFRNLLMVKVSASPEDVIDASDEVIARLKEQGRGIRSEEIMRGINIFLEVEDELKNSLQSRIPLEMGVIKFCKREYDTSIETVLSRLNALEEKIASGNFTPNVVNQVQNIKEAVKATKEPKVEVKKEEASKSIEEVEEVSSTSSAIDFQRVKKSWKDIIEVSRSQRPTIAALLSMGDIKEARGNVVVIEFPKQYGFSKTKLQNPEDKKIVEDSFSKVLQENVRVTFIVEEDDIDSSIERIRQELGDSVPIEIIEE